MSENSATKEKILQSAKKEFLEKGFTGASLRTIASNAGLTTGAMYRHFEDKNELFCALVDEAIETTANMINSGGMEAHMSSPSGGIGEEHYQQENFLMKGFLSYIYANFDAYTLLLTKAAGSTHENFLDEMCDLFTKNCLETVNWMKDHFGVTKQIDEMSIHVLATSIVTAYAEVILHKMPKEEAVIFLENIQDFFHFGFMHMLGLPCEH